MMEHGPALITVMGMTLPSASKLWVIPTFLPINPSTISFSSRAEGLDLDIDPGRQVQLLELFDRLVVILGDVDEPFVDAHLEVLARFLIDVGRPEDAIAMDGRRQGDRTADPRARPLGLSDAVFHRLVEQPVVERLKPDPDFFHCRPLASLSSLVPPR